MKPFSDFTNDQTYKAAATALGGKDTLTEAVTPYALRGKDLYGLFYGDANKPLQHGQASPDAQDVEYGYSSVFTLNDLSKLKDILRLRGIIEEIKTLKQGESLQITTDQFVRRYKSNEIKQIQEIIRLKEDYKKYIVNQVKKISTIQSTYHWLFTDLDIVFNDTARRVGAL